MTRAGRKPGFGCGISSGKILVMKPAWITHGLTGFAVWLALVGVTVLLTVLFSFLGNLSCAVLTGMILGAVGRWRWSAIPISLVFPTVILALSHFSRIELPPGKVQLIALLCGAAFWGVFGMTFGLHCFEHKQAVAPSTKGIPAPEPKPEFRLSALSGSWVCEGPSTNGSAAEKSLRIEAGKFTLTIGGRRGRARVIARGEVSLNTAQSDYPVVTFHPERDSPDQD